MLSFISLHTLFFSTAQNQIYNRFTRLFFSELLYPFGDVMNDSGQESSLGQQERFHEIQNEISTRLQILTTDLGVWVRERETLTYDGMSIWGNKSYIFDLLDADDGTNQTMLAASLCRCLCFINSIQKHIPTGATLRVCLV